MRQTDSADSAIKIAAGKRPPRAYAALEGVGRALSVLEAVAERPMRANEIAAHLGLKWTTAHRTLTHLLEQRYLRRDEATGNYSIGPRLYYLGQAYLFGHPLVSAGGQFLRAVAKEMGVSAQLNEREGFQAMTLFAVDHKLEAIPKTTPEFHFPLHTGSKGHVLLAYSGPEVLEAMLERPLVPLTEKSISDPNELRARLAEVRAQGYAITREDVQRGTGSVAAPAFHADGELAGAVCLIVKAEEMTEERVASLVGAVSRTAREISVQLGWRWGDQPKAIQRWEETRRPSRARR
jgi:DNA-binding IclR family transcriptional regulator